MERYNPTLMKSMEDSKLKFDIVIEECEELFRRLGDVHSDEYKELRGKYEKLKSMREELDCLMFIYELKTKGYVEREFQIKRSDIGKLVDTLNQHLG